MAPQTRTATSPRLPAEPDRLPRSQFFSTLLSRTGHETEGMYSRWTSSGIDVTTSFEVNGFPSVEGTLKFRLAVPPGFGAPPLDVRASGTTISVSSFGVIHPASSVQLAPSTFDRRAVLQGFRVPLRCLAFGGPEEVNLQTLQEIAIGAPSGSAGNIIFDSLVAEE